MSLARMAGCAAMGVLLGSVPCPAAASLEVLEAQGDLSYWVLYDSQHGPCSMDGWSHAVEDGVSFDLQATGSGVGCMAYDWIGRCDETGLVFSGDLNPIVDGGYGWWFYLRLGIRVLLETTAPIRVSAARDVEGVLGPELHTVVLTLPDGSLDVLLGPDGEGDSTERLLDAGIYRIELSVEGDDTWYLPFSYAGLVTVEWGTASMGQGRRTWGGVKSLWR